MDSKERARAWRQILISWLVFFAIGLAAGRIQDGCVDRLAHEARKIELEGELAETYRHAEKIKEEKEGLEIKLRELKQEIQELERVKDKTYDEVIPQEIIKPSEVRQSKQGREFEDAFEVGDTCDYVVFPECK